MEALWLSMKLAACVAVILLAIGTPMAYGLAFSNWRGKFLLESVLALPLVLPGAVTAAVLSFAHTLGEFGVVLMVGGNLAGVTRTVSIDIYDHVQSLEYGEANRMALVLLAVSFVVLSVVYAVNRRVWTPWSAN